MSDQKPDPGPNHKWRTLEPGAVIEEGDMHFGEETYMWHETQAVGDIVGRGQYLRRVPIDQPDVPQSKAMNRQSRVRDHGLWHNRGPVSFKEAAIAEAEYVATMVANRTLEIQVRDEAEPEIVHTLVVTRHETYSVEGLRGGE